MGKEGIHYSGPIIADGKLHRVNADDDKKGKKNVFYLLHLDARPAGIFGSNKLYGNEKKFSWKAEGAKPLSREERAALAEQMAAARAKRLAEEAARHESAKTLAATLWDGAKEAPTHPYLARKGVASHGLRTGVWKKARQDGSLYTLASDALLIPMRDQFKVTWGLQAIFAQDVMVGGEPRGKDFSYGAKKQGLWFSIGKPSVVDDQLTIVCCEGFATGASIHEATGLAVLVCFDAGNLIHVARTARRLMPKARIILAADNDQWTTIQGVPTNVGVNKAKDAATTVDGLLAAPFFKNINSKPTDFNDLHMLDGLPEVARQVFSCFRTVEEPATEEEPPPWNEAPDGPEGDDQHTGGAGAGQGGQLTVIKGGLDATEPEKKRRKARGAGDGNVGDPSAIQRNAWFRILGHDRDYIYIFQAEMKMVLCRKNTDWGRNAFLTLANMAWWQQNFPGGGKDGFDTAMAANAIIRHAFDVGYYDPTATRGRGAWRDAGRMIFHFGGKLLVDGDEMDVTDLRSNFVYEQGRHLKIPPTDALTGQDGAKIIKVAQAFHWTRPASAILLAGWVALAPLCGALRWRPHIWVTGGTGSGKSTVLNEFVWYLMDGMEVYAQGNSTEAGIRQTLMTDALPVLFDESEQNDERERFRVQSILALIRQASTESGAKTLKGTQMGAAQGFMIRSMFCLASVQVGMRHQADQERISVLSLRPKRTENKEQASKNWAAIKEAVDGIKADHELPGRLLRRSIQLLPITVQNIETFARVAADKFGSQREGDQYGAMLAGAWSLVKSTVATAEEARDMINRYDWTEYLEGSETEESTKALNSILERLIRTNTGDVSVYELVAKAAGREGEGAWSGEPKIADAHLRRHGIKIKWTNKNPADAALFFANNSTALADLMADTPYAADVKGQLLRVPGAFRTEPEKFNGLLSRAVGIPLLNVLDGTKDERPEIDYGDNLF